MILTKNDLNNIPKAKLQKLYKYYYPDESYWGLNKEGLIAEIWKAAKPEAPEVKEPERKENEVPMSVRVRRIKESQNG